MALAWPAFLQCSAAPVWCCLACGCLLSSLHCS
jgi:hypothetical protein